MSIKQDLRDVLLGKELTALCGTRINEELLKSRLAFIQRKTGLLKDCSVSDFADLCDLSKNPKCVEDSFDSNIEAEEEKKEDIDDLSSSLSGLRLETKPKYVKQAQSVTMAKCHPRPPYKWTSASKALGIPKGYCEKDVNYKPDGSDHKHVSHRKLKYDVSDLDTTLNECEICLGTELNGKGTVPLKCGHFFHKECLTGVQFCPTCRASVDFASEKELLKTELRNVLLGTEIMKECRAGKVPKEVLSYRLKYLQRHHDAFKKCSEDDFALMCDLKKDPSTQCKTSIVGYAQGRDISSEDEELNNCGICFSILDDKGKGTIPTKCGHFFHKECAEKWFLQSGYKCATCRQKTMLVGHAQVIPKKEPHYTLSLALNHSPEVASQLQMSSDSLFEHPLSIFKKLNWIRVINNPFLLTEQYRIDFLFKKWRELTEDEREEYAVFGRRIQREQPQAII